MAAAKSAEALRARALRLSDAWAISLFAYDTAFYMINKSKPFSSSSTPVLAEAAVLEAARYIVGDANEPSGYYSAQFDGRLGAATSGALGWEHSGWRNVRAFGMARARGALFVASGNGVLRSRAGGAMWRVTTDWRMTEVLALAWDPHAPSRLWATTAHGLWVTPDLGETWRAVRTTGLAPDERFGHAVAVCRDHAGHVLLGTEAGIRHSLDGGTTWSEVGPRAAVRSLAQSPHDTALWLAATDGAGALRSSDGGATWTAPSLPRPAAALYAAAHDPLRPGHAAAVGYRSGLLATTDDGATWTAHPLATPADAFHALAFDPVVPGRLWLGSIGHGVLVLDPGESAPRAIGPPETTVYALTLTIL